MFLSPPVCEDGRIFFVRVRVVIPATGQKHAFLHKTAYFCIKNKKNRIILAKTQK